MHCLKNFFSEAKTKIGTFKPQSSSQLLGTAVKNCNSSFFLICNLFEHFIPVWSTCVGSCFQTGNQVSFFLNKKILLIIFDNVGEIGFTFSWRRSSANCKPTAFMSVFCNALVMYICISKNLSMAPPSSACSISNWDSKLTNHSKDLWSLFIQKKSTWNVIVTVVA